MISVFQPYLYIRNIWKPKNFRNVIVQKIWRRLASSSLGSVKYSTEVNVQSNGVLKIYEFVPFDSVLEKRQNEAKRSILVQVHSKESCVQLHEYCTVYGHIIKMFHYSLPNLSNFVIVEFDNETSVKDLISKSSHFDQHQIIPVRSQFLWFKENLKGKKDKRSNKAKFEKLPLTLVSRPVCAPDEKDISSWLLSSETLSDQVLVLYQALHLDDLGVRIRFLTALQIQNALSGLFPSARAVPYGSTVNNFGKLGCDLDIAIQLDLLNEEEKNAQLVFHAKTSLTTSRSQQQRSIDLIGDLVQLLLPGCNSVRKILNARVPILRYKQELTGIECDLSLTNMSAVYMSELLYIFSFVDSRVRPLVYTIRYWAQSVNLTNSSPGSWITNFSLTLLTLFYLQQAKLLPSLSQLVKMARPKDKRLVENINCTFLRDISSLVNKPSTSDSLCDLLKGFFGFYSSFDFSSQAVSLGIGKPIPKQDYSALYIVNPLETHLNVSKNVSLAEVEKIKEECMYAFLYLKSENYLGEKDNNEEWGLLNIFQTRQKILRNKHKNNNNRLITVNDIFKEDVN